MECLTGTSLLERVERASYSENFSNEGSMDKISCVFTHEYKVPNNENFGRLLVFFMAFIITSLFYYFFGIVCLSRTHNFFIVPVS